MVAVLLLLVAALGCAPAEIQSDLAARDAGVRERHDGPGFRSTRKLEEHYAKHGREFGDISEDDYLRRARELRDRPLGSDVVEAVRPGDGVITRFDRGTGAFGAYEPDGTIRTFFKPDDGEAYFRRQAKRRPGGSGDR